MQAGKLEAGLAEGPGRPEAEATKREWLVSSKWCLRGCVFVRIQDRSGRMESLTFLYGVPFCDNRTVTFILASRADISEDNFHVRRKP